MQRIKNRGPASYEPGLTYWAKVLTQTQREIFLAYFDPQDKRLKEALERFKIKAWSFSTLEMWRDSPARGLMKALNLPSDPVGVAAIVGNATEKGIELALTGTPLDVAIDLGNQMLDDYMAFEDPDAIADLTKKTAQRITTGYDKLKEFGVPKCQVKIQYEPDLSLIHIWRCRRRG